MRESLTLLLLVLLSGLVQAQDPGTQAAQIVIQNTQIAVQAAQQANDWAMRTSQTTSQNAMAAQQQTSSLFDYHPPTVNTDHRRHNPAPPLFSVGTGTYSSPVTLTINASNSDAEIYYTTDGWTPTQYSNRYTAPIQIDSSVTLHAIAVSPWGSRSPVSEAVYTLNVKQATQSATFPGAVPGVVPSAAAAAAYSGRRLLARDTPVQVVFAMAVSSKTAKVGDRIFLTLAENLESDGVVVAREGTPAVAIITEVDKPHRLGAPGEVSFKLEFLQAKGINIKLRGGAAKLGQERLAKADAAGAFGVFVRGKDAQIDPGAEFTGRVASDIPLPAN